MTADHRDIRTQAAQFLHMGPAPGKDRFGKGGVALCRGGQRHKDGLQIGGKAGIWQRNDAAGPL